MTYDNLVNIEEIGGKKDGFLPPSIDFPEVEMMKSKRRFVEAVILCAFLYLVPPVNAVTPWLHVDGNKIKDPAGNVVVLRGIALIDLGFLEDWQGGAIEMIDRLTDKTDTQGSSPGWYPKVIRINVTPPDSVGGWPHPFNPGNTDLYDLLRTVVDYCATKDMYVIIDWHYIANTYDHVATTSEFWTYMAPRFANDSHVIFELFNEPINDIDGDWIFNSNDTTDWLSVRTDMQTWIDIVRTYAPNNLILAAGAFYSQLIGPAAAYPLTGNNIAMVSHIYPGHWCDSYWSSSYQNQITTCATVYPVIMTEWGFSQSNHPDPGDLLNGTITEYGLPLSDFREQYDIGHTAWVASYDWGPPMFWNPGTPLPPGTWDLRIGEGEMGGFVKDRLHLRRNDDQPGSSGWVQLSSADFEIGFGNWVNVTGDDSHDWTRDSGGTPSSDTGPSSGANGSTWYVFLETSAAGANYAGDTAYLESPEIDGISRTLTFYYHMYGEDMGELNVDVYSDGSWHNEVWSISGEQHSSHSDPYTQATVDLSAYTGTIKIRFRAVAAGGLRGDMAIDDIEVTGWAGEWLYGDLTYDNKVDMNDLSEFSLVWLVPDCNNAELDLDDDCVISLYEYSFFAQNWLEEI